MNRESFKAWLRCYLKKGYLDVWLRSPARKVALCGALLMVFLGVAGIEQDHRDNESEPQQTISVISPAATGNVYAQVVNGVGWFGDRIVMADIYANQRST